MVETGVADSFKVIQMVRGKWRVSRFFVRVPFRQNNFTFLQGSHNASFVVGTTHVPMRPIHLKEHKCT